MITGIVRSREVLMVVLVATVLLAGCSSSASGPGGETTCAEYLALQLPLEEQLLGGKRSEEQKDIVKRMLDDHGLDTGQTNMSEVDMRIVQFCGIGSTVVQENSDRPIEDVMDW